VACVLSVRLLKCYEILCRVILIVCKLLRASIFFTVSLVVFDYCMVSYSEYISSITVLISVPGIVTGMLIPPHECSVLRNSTAQNS